MFVIALFFSMTATAQTTPQEYPPTLKEGEMTYVVELTDGRIMYGRALTRDVDRKKNEGKFWVDEPDPSRAKNRQVYQFKSCTEEFSGREKRWKDAVDSWYRDAGHTEVEFANGTLGWVTNDEAEWSRRARESALSVLQEQESKTAIAEPASVSPETEAPDEVQPSFLVSWGPQVGVGLLGLVLMAVVAGLLIVPRSGKWENIE
jgi:hypothetical protein